MLLEDDLCSNMDLYSGRVDSMQHTENTSKQCLEEGMMDSVVKVLQNIKRWPGRKAVRKS